MVRHLRCGYRVLPTMPWPINNDSKEQVLYNGVGYFGRRGRMSVMDTATDGATILIVEDDPAMLIALHDILTNAGYDVLTASNGKAALQEIEQTQPALILSDISMPVMDGIQLFQAVRSKAIGVSIPFIFLTARGTRDDILAGKSMGVDDYITKPVTSNELVTAVRARLGRSKELMLVQMKESLKESVFALAHAIEMRDEYTHQHMHRLNAYAQVLGRELGWDESRLETLEFGAILHDIGKIYIPEAILCKEAALSDKEWVEMRKHPAVGARMIANVPYLSACAPIIRHHHENWDGSGYPDGLKGEAIPLEAQLLAVVDSFDAMTTDRSYRKRLPPQQAYDEICQLSGKQFSPLMVDAFQRCWERGAIKHILEQSNTP